MSDESPYMTLGEVAEELDMDRRQVTRLLERGVLVAEVNPVDARSKIVRRSDVEKLKVYPRKKDVA